MMRGVSISLCFFSFQTFTKVFLSGGTVDLIVFRVDVDASGNRKFRESTKGVGKSCGSTFIDRNFRKHLRKKLKKVIRRSPNGSIEIPEAPLDHMMDVFVGKFQF